MTLQYVGLKKRFASLLACVEECISERESRRFDEALNTKVKLDNYKQFGKNVEFKE